MICIDNSEWMRNGDYAPNRFQSQAEAVNLICGAKTQVCFSQILLFIHFLLSFPLVFSFCCYLFFLACLFIIGFESYYLLYVFSFSSSLLLFSFVLVSSLLHLLLSTFLFHFDLVPFRFVVVYFLYLV